MRRLPAPMLLLAVALLWAACSKNSSSPPTRPQPICSLSPAGLNFGAVTIGDSSTRTATLSNAGAGLLEGTLSVSGTGFRLVGSGAYSLAAGESQTVTVRFHPAGSGGVTGALYASQLGCSVALEGIGQPAASSCAVTPTALEFGSVTVGTSRDLTFTLANLSAALLSGTLSVSGAGFTLVGASMYAIAPGASQAFTVRCAPTTPGPLTGQIATGSSCGPLPCAAVGATPSVDGLCVVSPGTLDFGPVVVGEVATEAFTIRNNHGGATQLSGTISILGAGFTTQQTSYVLDPGQSVIVPVAFVPQALGSFSATVLIAQTGCGACGSSCSSVALSGSGTIAPLCTLTPGSLDFGTVLIGQEKDLTFILTNTGGGVLRGTVSEPCFGYSLVGAVEYALTAGESQTFTVRFTPAQVGTGSRPCTIETGAGACADLPCTAVGDGPPLCSITPTYLDFDTVLVGSYRDTIVSVQNQGGGRLEGHWRSLGPYTVVGDSSFSLGAWESKAIQLRFTPARAGRPSVQGNLVYPATLGCPSMQLWGTGVEESARELRQR